MLEQAEAAGLPLPQGWAKRYEQDVTAPSIGTWAGWGALFITRRKRVCGVDVSERLHTSIVEQT
jgi:hypothetical protein